MRIVQSVIPVPTRMGWMIVIVRYVHKANTQICQLPAVVPVVLPTQHRFKFLAAKPSPIAGVSLDTHERIVPSATFVALVLTRRRLETIPVMHVAQIHTHLSWLRHPRTVAWLVPEMLSLRLKVLHYKTVSAPWDTKE